MMKFEKVMELTGQWAGTLTFFPSEPEARIGIAQQIARIVASEDQLRWLVEVIPTLYSDWPAMREIRAVLCMKFRPLDGVEVVSESFPDGLSREQLNPGKRIEAPAPLRLEGCSADAEMAATVDSIAQIKRMPPAPSIPLRAGENDYEGLLRTVEESKARPPRIQTGPLEQHVNAELARIRRQQEANRSDRWAE